MTYRQQLIHACFLSLSVLAAAANAQAASSAKDQSIHSGEEVFMQRCMQCHSVNQDQVLLGPSLWGEMNRSPHKKTASQVRVIVRDGKGKMPPWKDILSDQDINNLLAYLRNL